MTAIALSLISHTNAGKTTLARTLLGRDVGEIRDAPNVTREATPYPMIETLQGDALVLWDTPGFGDSARLARRLAQQGNPIGWFQSQVWDRFRDRAFYLSQVAVANVRDESDVVLYLVNASEAPDDAGYLQPEMTVLEWIAKPVIVLLNQTGPPRPREEEAAREMRWRDALAVRGERPQVHAVVSLDAFARCWVQEIALLRIVGDAIAPAKQEVLARLAAAWQSRRLAQFDESMEAIVVPIASAVCDHETLPEAGVKGALANLGNAIARRTDDSENVKVKAVQALAARLDAEILGSMERLIAIHQLPGDASRAVLERLSGVEFDEPLSEGKAAVMGGVVSGALTGLATDLAAGGFTFGAGMLTGAVLGALGGAGIARGMNLVRGRSGTLLHWDDAVLHGLVTSALLRYLAVAHYGRGRGDWVESEYPPFWRPLVARIVEARRKSFARIWSQRAPDCDTRVIGDALRVEVTAAAREILDVLYPGALPG